MAKLISFSGAYPRLNLKPNPRFSTSTLCQSSINKPSQSNFNPLRFTPPKTPSNHFPVKLAKCRGDQARHGATPNCSAPLSRADSAAEVAEQKLESEDDVVVDDKSSPSTWIDVYLPEMARPYAYLLRLNNLFLPWLLCWPYFWSIALAAEPGKLVDVKMLALFLVIAFNERNIIMTVNDLLDRDIDAKIKRTKLRPLAAGSITTFQAVCFLGLQLLVNFGLYHLVNNLSRTLWILSVPFSFTYPLTKRLTHWSQAYFSMTVHWGALLGWTAVKGSLDPINVLLPLYISGFFWTLLYETIYASQDKEEDAKLGLKSTAILFGDSIKIWLTGFGVAVISGLALIGFDSSIGWPYYAFLVPAACQLAWQIFTVDLTNPADCKMKQKSNKWFGGIVFLGDCFGKSLFLTMQSGIFGVTNRKKHLKHSAVQIEEKIKVVASKMFFLYNS